MKYYYFPKKAILPFLIQCIYFNFPVFCQPEEEHIYYHLVFELNDSETWLPSLKQTTICKGEKIKITVRFAPTQGGSAAPLYFSNQHYSILKDCSVWDCSKTNVVEPTVDGDGICQKDIVPGNCGFNPDSRITLFVKPDVSTKIRLSWDATLSYDAVPASALCFFQAPEKKVIYHYSDSFSIEVKDPQPPVLSPSKMAINQGSGFKFITATFPADRWNFYMNWYQNKCENDTMFQQALVNWDGQTMSQLPVYPNVLGDIQIKAKLAQMNSTCLSNFSQPAIITIKPGRLFKSGCNQGIVNTIESNLDIPNPELRKDYHFYKLKKELCKNCDLEEVWRKYKSNITNQAVIFTDQMGVLRRGYEDNINIGFSKLFLPEEKYDGPITDCATTKLPRITTFMINAAIHSRNIILEGAGYSGLLLQSLCSQKGRSLTDPIFMRVDEASKCVVNYTSEEHILYPGKLTRCLVKDECNNVNLLTFGEGTTLYEGTPCGCLLSGINKWWGESMFMNVDERFASSLNNQPPNSQTIPNIITTTQKSTSQNTTSQNSLIYKNWIVKSYHIKYAESDSLFTFYSSTDTSNLMDFRKIQVYFGDGGKYSGFDTEGEKSEGTWSYDSASKTLITDTSLVNVTSQSDTEFTIKGIIPVLKDTSYSTAKYFATFIRSGDADPCAGDQTPPVITPKNITVYLNASGQATIQPFDVIQSVTDNCKLDSSSIHLSVRSFTCLDVGTSSDTTTAPTASHLAYVASTSAGNQVYGGELGMEFTVNKRILISQLGAFDHQGNGINGTQGGGIRVAIFNKATQQIVPGLDAIVSGLADGFASNHRLKNIIPVQLLPGNYVVVAKGYNANELNGNSRLGLPIITGDNAAGAISYTGLGLYGSEGAGFSYPQNPDYGPANRYLAGTFSFSVDSTTPPAATHQAYTASTSTGNQAYRGELGMAFSVNTSNGITISRLGAFDHNADGISGSQNGGIRVAIFNQATLQIVAGLNTIIKGSADTLIAGYRFVNITPVSLPPGGYLVVTKGYSAGELNGNAGLGTTPPAGTDNAGGAIVYTGGGLYGSEGTGFSYPQNTDGGPASRYLTGSFIYSVNNGSSVAAATMASSRNAILTSGSMAASTHQAYTASTSTGNQSYGGELGMEFTVNNSAGIIISQLGVFDHQGNGITGTQNGGIRVAIFSKASKSIVAGLEAIITGQADAYAFYHRLKNITPVTLLPGDYVVVTKGYNGQEFNGNVGSGNPPAGTDDAAGAITYTGNGLYGNEGAGFSYPLNADVGPSTRYLAGTFVYSVGESGGSKSVKITASDSKGSTATATAQVTVKDTLGACKSAVVAGQLLQAAFSVEQETDAAIKAYPNPAMDRLTVQLSGMRGTKGTIEVLDLNGRVLEQRLVSFAGKEKPQAQVFILSAKAAGIYFIRIQRLEGVKVIKVVVAR